MILNVNLNLWLKIYARRPKSLCHTKLTIHKDKMIKKKNFRHFLSHFFSMEIYYVFMKTSLNIVPSDLINNESWLVQAMAGHAQATGHLLKQWWPKLTQKGVFIIYHHLYRLVILPQVPFHHWKSIHALIQWSVWAAGVLAAHVGGTTPVSWVMAPRHSLGCDPNCALGLRPRRARCVHLHVSYDRMWSSQIPLRHVQLIERQ